MVCCDLRAIKTSHILHCSGRFSFFFDVYPKYHDTSWSYKFSRCRPWFSYNLFSNDEVQLGPRRLQRVCFMMKSWRPEEPLIAKLWANQFFPWGGDIGIVKSNLNIFPFRLWNFDIKSHVFFRPWNIIQIYRVL